MTNIVRLTLLLVLIYVSAATAQHRPETAWLIYPQMKGDSPRIEIWATSGGSSRFVWRLKASNGSLLAEVPEPTPKKTYSFNQGECRIDGVLRWDIVAMVKHSEKREWSQQVEQVWIADPNNKRFVIRDGRGVECRNESYGV